MYIQFKFSEGETVFVSGKKGTIEDTAVDPDYNPIYLVQFEEGDWGYVTEEDLICQ